MSLIYTVKSGNVMAVIEEEIDWAILIDRELLHFKRVFQRSRNAILVSKYHEQ